MPGVPQDLCISQSSLQAQSDDISKKKILDDINQQNTLNPSTPFNYVEHEDDNDNEQIDIQMVNRKIGREVLEQPIQTFTLHIIFYIIEFVAC